MSMPDPTAPEVPPEPNLDEEFGTAFDWLDAPPQLWRSLAGEDMVIEVTDRGFCREVNQMLNSDGGSRSLESALTLPLRQATVTIEPPDKDSGQAEFIHQVLVQPPEAGGMQTPFKTFIGQCAGAIGFKKSFFEKVFTRMPDGRIGYSKLANRPASSCQLKRHPQNGEILSFRQYQYDPFLNRRLPGVDPDGYADIPANRAFVLIHGTHREPLFGLSDLEVPLWAHKMKKKILMLWLTFLDAQATPAMAAFGQDGTEAKARARILSQLRNGGVVGLKRHDPTEKVFEQIMSSGSGASEFQTMCRWLDSQAAQSVLAGWMNLSDAASAGRGSFALSSDLSQLYLASRHGVASEFADQITTGVIAPLIAINFGVGAPVPRIKFEKINQNQIDLAVQTLTTLGSTANPQVPGEFLDLLIEMVAQYLDLPAEKVNKILKDHATELQNQRDAAQKLRENNPLLAQTGGANPAAALDGGAQAARSQAGAMVDAAGAAMAKGRANSPVGNGRPSPVPRRPAPATNGAPR